MLIYTIFFLYRGEETTHVINLDLTNKTIMVMPFHKSTLGLAHAQPTSSSSQISSSTQQTHSAVKTSLVAPTKKPAKPAIKKQEKKKAVQKAGAVKKAEPKKEEVQKIEQKEQQPALVPDKEPAYTNEQELNATSQENIVYAGQLELEALELSMSIKQELELVWKPPRGLKPAHCCKVKVAVGMDGKANDITIQESSHILVFDTSVRQALQSMNFPQRSYGKELILPFR